MQILNQRSKHIRTILCPPDTVPAIHSLPSLCSNGSPPSQTTSRRITNPVASASVSIASFLLSLSLLLRVLDYFSSSPQEPLRALSISVSLHNRSCLAPNSIRTAWLPSNHGLPDMLNASTSRQRAHTKHTKAWLQRLVGTLLPAQVGPHLGETCQRQRPHTLTQLNRPQAICAQSRNQHLLHPRRITSKATPARHGLCSSRPSQHRG